MRKIEKMSIFLCVALKPSKRYHQRRSSCFMTILSHFCFIIFNLTHKGFWTFPFYFTKMTLFGRASCLNFFMESFWIIIFFFAIFTTHPLPWFMVDPILSQVAMQNFGCCETSILYTWFNLKFLVRCCQAVLVNVKGNELEGKGNGH